MKPIPLTQGVVLIGAETANKIIAALTALQNMQVNPPGAGVLTVGDLCANLNLQAITDRVQTIERTLYGSNPPSSSTLYGLVNQFADASISAVCNGDGTITVTLDWAGGGS